MGVGSSLHPTAAVLTALAQGKIAAAAAESVLAHLNNCADCREELAAMTNDDFLIRLRQAHDPGSTQAPGQTLNDAGRNAPPPLPPTVFNLPPELAEHPEYEILGELGRGGMGIVYRARHRLSGRLEVIKVMSRALMGKADSRVRFLREIQSAARLDHKNVVKMYTAQERGELLVLVMEYVPGANLAQVVSRGPLTVLDACSYVQQAATGLQHAFDKGMIHRDIKPQNLILTHEGKKQLVKVLDFGLAKATHGEDIDTVLTGRGAMMGTPGYVAPEQSRDAATVDIRADIYSLGCTLYHLLAGSPPFSGGSLFEIVQAHHSMEPRPLNVVRPEVPAELAAMVGKMMAKDAAQRYQTPLEVVRALEPFVKVTPKPFAPQPAPPKEGQRVAASPLPLPETIIEDRAPLAGPTKPAGATRSRMWPIALAIVLLAGLLALIIGFGPWSPVPSTDVAIPTSSPGGSLPRTSATHLPSADVAAPLVTNSIGMKLALVKPGVFLMGSPANEAEDRDDEHQHEVEITRPFHVGVHEVTQEQYERVMGTNPSWFSATKGGKDKVVGMDTRQFPVENVSWMDAVEFCRRLSELPEEKNKERTYRLPTEAEWEYVCRGGPFFKMPSPPFSFGNSLSHADANFDGKHPYGGAAEGVCLERTTKVGSYPANPLGVYDLHGNVWEWCSDWHDAGYYKRNIRQDPQGPENGKRRVLRGGSWYGYGRFCRAAFRSSAAPRGRDDGSIGFRVVLVAGART